jgi:DNA-binding MarR family transcriptional regulator
VTDGASRSGGAQQPRISPTHPAVPLARLFAIAYHHLVAGLHERLAERGWHDVRPSYGYVLLAARDGGTTSTALAELLGVSKQATSKLLDAMEGSGYVTRQVGLADGRVRLVTLTARGRRLLDVVEQVYQELEAHWAAVIGGSKVDQMRSMLVRILTEEYGGELPPVRPVS